jgi:hypothetical protein
LYLVSRNRRREPRLADHSWRHISSGHYNPALTLTAWLRAKSAAFKALSTEDRAA